MPFLQLTTSHIAGSHFSRPIGESSKIGPDLQRELLTRVFLVALEHPSVGQVGHIEGAAARALDIAVRPAETDHEFMAVVRFGEENDRLLKSSRPVFAGVHAENFSISRIVSQLYYYPT